MIVVLERLQIRQAVAREKRPQVLVAAEQDALHVRPVLGVQLLQPVVVAAGRVGGAGKVVAQEARGQARDLGEVLVPDVVLGDRGGHAFEVAGGGAALAADAGLERPVADGQGDDVALAGAVGVAAALQVALENGRAHGGVEVAGAVKGGGRPLAAVLPHEPVPGGRQGGAAAGQPPVGSVAGGRVVEGAHDPVQFTGGRAGGAHGRGRPRRVEGGRLAHGVQVAHIEHVAHIGRAVVVGHGLRLAGGAHRLEAGRRGGRGGARVHHHLEPHVGHAPAVGERFAVRDHQAGHERTALGQGAGRGRRAGTAELVDVVIRDVQRTVEPVQGHHRRGRDLRPDRLGKQQRQQKTQKTHGARLVGVGGVRPG